LWEIVSYIVAAGIVAGAIKPARLLAGLATAAALARGPEQKARRAASLKIELKSE
jgi:hypothetical protein